MRSRGQRHVGHHQNHISAGEQARLNVDDVARSLISLVAEVGRTSVGRDWSTRCGVITPAKTCIFVPPV